MEERTSDSGNIPQVLLDYSGAELFEIPCDVTLCFVSDGLVGFNYHDTRKMDYRDWFEMLETKYGVPTEAGNGMASWYENPIGKNTALYLFHLEEGVQISFYVTAGTPDQSYTGKKEEKTPAAVPAPELRTPLVPVTPELTRPETTAVPKTTEEISSVSETERINPETIPETETIPEAEQLPEEIPDSGMPETETAVSSSVTSTAGSTSSSSSTSAASTTVTTTTEKNSSVPETQNETEPPLQNLEFYASPDSERKKMSHYTQLYEYRTEEPGQPWELIMEYENVPFRHKSCDAVLCFTSLGLVGINYFDADVSAYQNWVSVLSDDYGSPAEIQSDYTV